MNSADFIIRQLAKTNKKNYENYVITGIWHQLDRTDVKIVTQQYVSRPEGHALTDLYFPQLDIHIEVDEPHHEKNKVHDLNRETDIIDATGHDVLRIKVTDDLEDLNAQINSTVDTIKSKLSTLISKGDFEPWDIDKEFDPEYYIRKGYLDVDENPAFRRIVDACNCLGQNYKGVQSAWFKSKKYPSHYIWFPKFYKNDDWDNSISPDGKVIVEKCLDPSKVDEWFDRVMSMNVKRITFPRSYDNLGFVLYRFKGVFETDVDTSSKSHGIVHRRVSTKFIL